MLNRTWGTVMETAMETIITNQPATTKEEMKVLLLGLRKGDKFRVVCREGKEATVYVVYLIQMIKEGVFQTLAEHTLSVLWAVQETQDWDHDANRTIDLLMVNPVPVSGLDIVWFTTRVNVRWLESIQRI